MPSFSRFALSLLPALALATSNYQYGGSSGSSSYSNGGSQYNSGGSSYSNGGSQYSSGGSGEYPASTMMEGGFMMHTVTVGGVDAAGNPMLVYNPESVDAAVGDMVRFMFLQKNHTATVSSFDQPCVASGGEDSGFMPNPDGKDGVYWDMPVMTAEPIWMYCKQKDGNHCGSGMVFAVNPAKTGDKTMADYKQLAVSINGTGDAYAPIVDGGSGTDDCNTASQTYTMPAPTQTGYGMTDDGSQCSCSCACGAGEMPYGAGMGAYGGYVAAI